MMTTQKPPNPQPQADPEDPDVVTGRRLRIAVTAAIALLLAAMAGGYALAHLTGHPDKAGAFLWWGARWAITGALLVVGVAFLIPRIARFFGLPEIGRSDEREYRVRLEAGYTTFLMLWIGLFVYGLLFVEDVALVAAMLTTLVYYGQVIWRNRRL